MTSIHTTSAFREPLRDGVAWALKDDHGGWTVNVSVPALLHEDGLLCVVAALRALRTELALALTARPGATPAMTDVETPWADWRLPPTGCHTPDADALAWNAMDHEDRWTLDVRMVTPRHHAGLLAVEAALGELIVALGFAVNPFYGNPVQP